MTEFKCVNFKLSFDIDILNMEVNITREWMSDDVVDDQSTPAQVMAW